MSRKSCHLSKSYPLPKLPGKIHPYGEEKNM
nr:MAG TPA: hypothetical protein [Caudoviricetes sp.]